MRRIVGAAALILVGLSTGLAYSQPTTDSPASSKPRLYALIAAVGEQITEAYEVQSTGSHLSPFRQSRSHVPNNALNRFVLHSLDVAIENVDPESQRVYLSLSAVPMDGVPAPKQDSFALGIIVAELEKIPERLNWDRIVIATPAYESLARNGMPGKIRGFGMFAQPLCQAGCPKPGDPYPAGIDAEPLDGVAAVTSDDTAIRAKTFLAPFSYIEVWVLDPNTLAVLDRQQSFDHQKLAEPIYTAPMSEGDLQRYLARRATALIETSISAAVMRSEVNLRRGTVELGPLKDVTPDDAKR
jgi:hypothetical protein